MAEQYVLRALPSSQQAEWDTFVEEHPQGHFLQSWGWGELKRGANWQPLRLALYARREDTIVAAAQVLRKTALHLPPRLGHLAYLPKGPVLDWTALTANGTPLAQLFLLKLRAYLRGQGALALQVEPGLALDAPTTPVVLDILRELGFQQIPAIQPLRTIALDIQPDEEILLAQMKEKWRYNIRLARRKGVEVRVATSLAELRAWYTLLETTGERDQFGIHTLAYYSKAWEIFGPREQARLFLAYANDELLAGIFVTRVAHEAIYLYGASSNVQRNLMPNYLLQWEAIRWAKQSGASSYDFWGIPATDEADEAMAGVYRFKSGWGGQIVSFPGNYQYAYHPHTLRLASKILGR
ncbi:MAG TPA: peptidoglycan bridge formation glycyltransferase FemA/FemB family protein [Ktedonobacteraceae bacterium]|jgi:lipid II:glycine glycyltransferase (peptidoglycan interpeptide bridge formation enzyme)